MCGHEGRRGEGRGSLPGHTGWWDCMGHAVTQQLGANHTCAHIGAALSRARWGHLGTQPATPVLLLTLSPSCKSLWNPPPPDGAPYCTGCTLEGQSMYRLFFIQSQAKRIFYSFLFLLHIQKSFFPYHSPLSVLLMPSGRRRRVRSPHQYGYKRGSARGWAKRRLMKDYSGMIANNQELIHCVALSHR